MSSNCGQDPNPKPACSWLVVRVLCPMTIWLSLSIDNVLMYGQRQLESIGRTGSPVTGAECCLPRKEIKNAGVWSIMKILFLGSSSVTVLEWDDLTGTRSQQYQNKLGVLLLTIPLTVACDCDVYFKSDQDVNFFSVFFFCSEASQTQLNGIVRKKEEEIRVAIAIYKFLKLSVKGTYFKEKRARWNCNLLLIDYSVGCVIWDVLVLN